MGHLPKKTMSRGALLVIVIVLILAIIGVGLALFWKPGLLNGNTNKQNTNTIAANTNAALNANEQAQFKANVLETKTVDQTPTYRNTNVPIDRVDVTNGYTGMGAAKEGKKIVIVYLKKDAAAQGTTISEWLGQEIRLEDSDKNSYRYDTAQFISQYEGDSYIAFSVDEKASGFTLRFVRDGEDVSVPLGI